MFKLSSDHLANFRGVQSALQTITGWINDIRRRFSNVEERIEILESTPSGGITLPIDAVDVDYDNATSGLTATDVQAAIDELAASVGTAVIPHQWDDAFTKTAEEWLSTDHRTLANNSGANATSCAAVSHPCAYDAEKVYFEVLWTGGASDSLEAVGIVINDSAHRAGADGISDYGTEDVAGFYYLVFYNSGASNLYYYRNSTSTGAAGFGSAWANPQRLGIAVNRNTGSIYLTFDGSTWQGGFDPVANDATGNFLNDSWKRRFRVWASCYKTGKSALLCARSADLAWTPPTGYSALAG